jgi:phenylpyruvate tautomerase PptA (4-oxalocrotonate tautomerase family)
VASAAACFPEPEVDDPTPGAAGEPTWRFLARSTWTRAVELRRFYNENLATLSPAIAARLCRGLRRGPSQASHFELVVGRFLQALGAEQLEYEPVGSEGRHVDWLARFPDGHVSVEATAPAVNSVVGEELKASEPAIAIVLEEVPPGWWILAGRVPWLGNQRRQWFRKRVRQLFADLPPAQHGATLDMEETFEDGRLDLTLFGQEDPSAPSRWGGGPAVGYFDDTSTVVHRAIEGKRAQARGAEKPVLAALYTGGFGSNEVEKFDIALFGRSVSDLSGEIIGFHATGVFGSGEGEPTFAGALAFGGLGWRGGPDPIVYVHPRFTGSFPAAVASLRRRELTDRGIVETPAERDGLLQSLGWPEAAVEE